MTIKEEIIIDENTFFEVELTGEIEEIDNTYDDEYGTVYFKPYLQLKDFPVWNHNLYGFQENWLIAIHILTKFQSIEKSFINLELSFANDFDYD